MDIPITRIAVTAAIALLAVAAGPRPDDTPDIGPTPIPFYTGNLSVWPFMGYWGTTPGAGDDSVNAERIALLRRIGCFADCDYQAWCLAERERGRWDFSGYRRNADLLHAAGLGYIPFSWVHFPPKWHLQDPDFVPYQCAEHGGKLMQLSPWSPRVWDTYRRFYAAQREAMGERIGWIRVSTPSDYGEIGYPAAMTSWLVPQEHAHAGYWCGDPYARADFRAQMRLRFRTLSALNARWGTSFGSWDAVTYPELAGNVAAARARTSGKTVDRRRWLDFVEWYYGVWLRFLPRMAALIREQYPTNRLIASVGYSSESTCYGNDYSAIPRAAKRARLALQTPGNVSYYGVKRVSTACHHYGCAFYTEPPGNVPPDAEIERVFCDVSNGVQVYFEYPQNLDQVRARLREYKHHMTGARPVVDLALFHPTTHHRLEAGANNFPRDVFALAEAGRDRFDFDVVDETLIADGALRRYRVLVYVSGAVVEATTLRRLEAWVRAGGVLLTCVSSVESVEGDVTAWGRLVPAEVGRLTAVQRDGAWDWPALMRSCSRPLGRGLVIRLPTVPSDVRGLVDAVTHAASGLHEVARGFHSAPLVDGEADGVLATLLPDRVLYFNRTQASITKRVAFRPEDWRNRARKPARMEEDLPLGPYAIGAVMLR